MLLQEASQSLRWVPCGGSTFYLIPAQSSLLWLCFSVAPALRQEEPKLNVSWITAGGEGKGVAGNALETQASAISSGQG